MTSFTASNVFVESSLSFNQTLANTQDAVRYATQAPSRESPALLRWKGSSTEPDRSGFAVDERCETLFAVREADGWLQYTLIPGVVYLNRVGKRFSLSFGKTGRVSAAELTPLRS